MQKINSLILLILILSSFILSAEEFTINKYEVQLETLGKQHDKALETIELKVKKAKQGILEKYYNDLEKHFNYQMRAKNLELANKVNAKKEQIFKLFKETQEDLKPKPKTATAAKTNRKSAKMVFLSANEMDSFSSYSKDFKRLVADEMCFKKGGDYVGEEKWKTIPSFLKGKLVSFLSHEKDSSNSRSYFKANRDGYVYYLSTSSRSGHERIGKVVTTGGKGFHVYKWYLYKGDSVSAYCSGSYESLIVINN